MAEVQQEELDVPDDAAVAPARHPELVALIRAVVARFPLAGWVDDHGRQDSPLLMGVYRLSEGVGYANASGALLMVVVVGMPVRHAGVLAEDERLDRDRHRTRWQPDLAEVDVVELDADDRIEDAVRWQRVGVELQLRDVQVHLAVLRERRALGPGGEISGAVHPLPGRPERVGDEPFRHVRPLGLELGVVTPALFTALVLVALVTTFMTGPASTS